MPTPPFSIDTRGQLAPHDGQEWLLTNGTGAYADGTVAGVNTRRYHGLLVAALAPPVGRVVTVNRLAERVSIDDGPARELSVNFFDGGVVHPHGEQYLNRFTLGDDARWGYVVDGCRVDKHVQLVWGKQAAAVRYSIYAGTGPDGRGRPFRLDVRPFVSLRDFHSLRHAGPPLPTTVDGRRVTVEDGPLSVTISADGGTFAPDGDWWYRHVYPVEAERGQDDHEDLFTPGTFTFAGRGRATLTVWITLNPAETFADYDAELARRPAVPMPPRPTSAAVNRLARAAADFVVARRSPDGTAGTTILAGYPWFADWGRDTMIALPGLLLTTRRFAEAKGVLSVFAQYVDRGMIPNRFDDYTGAAEYNTVDASLWFVHAAFAYAAASGDDATLAEVLLPACRKIVDGYRDGTRYGIGMDPADGLIRQGDADTQLTWMDAKTNGVTFTPRQGKPVEINALWYHALVLMREDELAGQVRDSFRAKFYLGDEVGLADVVADDGTPDRSCRPNQIFAVSLGGDLLTPEQQRAVVAVVQRELLTPVGLRTLSPSDPGYRGRYTGDQFHRDGAYHNGTVWPWLVGPFCDAYLVVNGRGPAAAGQVRQWLRPLMAHYADAGAVGQVAEVYDGDEPRRPLGCFAQAWSVAEVLRVAASLGT